MRPETAEEQDSRIDQNFQEGRGAYADSNAVKDAEENPDGGEWKTNISADDGGSGGSGSSKGTVRGFAAKAKKRGPLATIIITGIIGLVAGGGFLSTALGPIAFVENVVDDLNDQLAAMDIASVKLMRNKIPSSDRREAVRGCTKASIRCKFATLSSRQVAKLERTGIQVTGADTSFGRVVPESYTFQGQDFSPDEWARELNSNRSAQQAQRRANNMKWIGTSDATFTGRVLQRFGISKRPPELSGTPQERVNALMNKAGTSNPTNISFTPVDSEGNPVSGDAEPSGYILDGSSDDRVYEPHERDRMVRSLERVQNTRPPSRVTRASIGALSVLGYWDLACSISNMLGAASTATKVANQMQMIEFAMGISSKVHEMKAGDITPEDAEALGTFFAQTDGRQTIPDISTAVSEYETDVVSEPEPMDNPNYGRNALDSSLYQMSSLGGVANQSTVFSHGFGQNSLLANVSGAAEIASALANIGTGGVACGFVQHGITRALGILGAVIAGATTGGAAVAFQAAVAGGMISAMLILETMLNNALSGNIIEEADLGTDPVARGDAVWSGTAGMLSASAQARGLTPGNAEQIVAYKGLTNQVNDQYIALESETAHPFDVKDQYSFVGSLARSVLQHTAGGNSGSAHLGKMASLVRGGLLSPFSQAVNAQSTADPERFRRCDDEGYRNIGIDADVQCNVRFVMPQSALALDPEDVAAWMETNGYVEPDTETGFPRGYTPPSASEAQEGALDLVVGVAGGFVDQFVDSRASGIDDYNEYAQFLDYCVYRTVPFGETYNDNNPINGVSSGWDTGEKCMEDSETLDNFRMYTLYVSVNDGLDEEEPAETEGVTAQDGDYTLSPDVSSNWTHPSANRTYRSVFMSTQYQASLGLNHLGVDITNTFGSPVYSACDGVVTKIVPENNRVADLEASTHSNAIIVHCGGNVVTTYNHTAPSGVSAGMEVTAGQQIGTSDCSGVCTGAHLHLNMKVDGEFIDPVPFMRARGVDLGQCVAWCS